MSEEINRAKAEIGTRATRVRPVPDTGICAHGMVAHKVSHRSGMTFTSYRVLLFAFCLLLSVFCLPVQAQLGSNQSSGPLYSPRPELGQSANGLPSALKDIGIDQHLNQQLPLDLEFNDETGKTVKLAEYFHGKPVVLVLAYYNCPMLCTQVLNGLTGAMKGISFDAGREYEVLTVSFDPREKSDLAASKKQLYVSDYQRPTGAQGWHFLTGEESSIKKLADVVGYRYRFDAATNQYAHASGIMVLTPEGKLSRYFYGIEYAPKDFRLALVDASANKIGSPVDQLLLYCYHYDPSTGKYGLVIMNVVRLAGIVTVFSMILLILILRKRGLVTARLRAGGTA
jgi:protein SCO1/2